MKVKFKVALPWKKESPKTYVYRPPRGFIHFQPLAVFCDWLTQCEINSLFPSCFLPLFLYKKGPRVLKRKEERRTKKADTDKTGTIGFFFFIFLLWKVISLVVMNGPKIKKSLNFQSISLLGPDI